MYDCLHENKMCKNSIDAAENLCGHCLNKFYEEDEGYVLEKNNIGKTALHICIFRNSYFLLENILSKENVNTQDDEGNTLLHEAIESSCDINIIKLLMNRGANPRIKNNKNITSIDLVKNMIKKFKGGRLWKDCYNPEYRDYLFGIKKELMKK
jgi:ankyrin repeat protein